MHTVDTSLCHTFCTQRVTQLSYQHLSMPHYHTARMGQYCSSAALLLTTKCTTHDMETTEVENYSSKSPLPPPSNFQLKVICQSNKHCCDLSVLSLHTTCLWNSFKFVCTWFTESYANCERYVTSAHFPCSLQALHSPAPHCQVCLPTHTHI